MAALLVGRGVEDVRQDAALGASFLTAPGYLIRVGGLLFHERKADPMVLWEMRHEHPGRAPVAIRLVDPEIEKGLVMMHVDDWIDLMVRAQR